MSPAPFLSAYLCCCRKQLCKKFEKWLSVTLGMCRWAPFFGPSWEQDSILQMTLVRVRLWQCDQTRCKQLKRHFMWVIAGCDMSRGVIWRSCEWVQKANELPVFPFCLFKYWNTESFRREIMLQGLAEQMRFLLRITNKQKKKEFQIPGCEWVCVSVTSAKPVG